MALTIGDYEILGRDTSGGAGLPYLAQHTGSGEQVSLKVLLERGADGEQLAQAEELARVLRIVDHPGVQPLQDVGRDASGSVYLVTTPVDGRSLHELLVEREQLPEQETRAIGLGIAAALIAASAKELHHGSLQPRSIVLRPDGSVLIMDFGLRSLIPLYAGGSFLPADEYVAPEMAHGQPSEALDAFALGVILRQCLTGSPRGLLDVSCDFAFASNALPEVVSRLVEPDPRRRLTVRDAAALLSPPAPVVGGARPNIERGGIRLFPEAIYEPTRRGARSNAGLLWAVAAAAAAVAFGLLATFMLRDGSGSAADPPVAASGDAAPAGIVAASGTREGAAQLPATPSSEPTSVPPAVAPPATRVPPSPVPPTAVPPVRVPSGVAPAADDTERQLVDAVAARATANSSFYRTRDVADVSGVVTGAALGTYQAEATRLTAMDAYIDSVQTEFVVESMAVSGDRANVTTIETWDHVDRRASTGEVIGSRRARARVTYGLVQVDGQWLVSEISHQILSITPL